MNTLNCSDVPFLTLDKLLMALIYVVIYNNTDLQFLTSDSYYTVKIFVTNVTHTTRPPMELYGWHDLDSKGYMKNLTGQSSILPQARKANQQPLEQTCCSG